MVSSILIVLYQGIFDIAGGILFKIFVIGETIQVVRRSSLPNITKNDMSKMTGVIKFPRVSSAASSVVDADLDPTIAGEAWKIFIFPHKDKKGIFVYELVFHMYASINGICFTFYKETLFSSKFKP